MMTTFNIFRIVYIILLANYVAVCQVVSDPILE